MASFCSKCGTAATPGIRFCSNCGTPLEAPSPPYASPAPAFSTPASAGGFGSSGGGFPPGPKKSGLSTLIWVLLGIVLALLLAFGSCSYIVIHKARQVASRVKAELPNVQRQLEEKNREVQKAGDPCALVTTAELEEVYGVPFEPGERHGTSCSFTKVSQAQASITIEVDRSLSRYDEELQRSRRAYPQERIGEARAYFPNSSTIRLSYRWSYVEIAAEGGRPTCERIARLVLKRL